MITTVEGVDPGALAGEVAVYWKLPSGPWSIAPKPNGKVIARADALALHNVRFAVSQATWRAGFTGRNDDGTVSKRGVKRNVVAWATGKLADGEVPLRNPRRVTFRFFGPEGIRQDGDRLTNGFVYADTGERVDAFDAAVFDRDGHMWVESVQG